MAKSSEAGVDSARYWEEHNDIPLLKKIRLKMQALNGINAATRHGKK